MNGNQINAEIKYDLGAFADEKCVMNKYGSDKVTDDPIEEKKCPLIPEIYDRGGEADRI